MMLQTKKQTRIYEDIQWAVVVTKDKYNQKAEGYDGYYEYWLNNKDYGIMTHVFGMELKNWKEAEEYIEQCTNRNQKQEYWREIKKLEADSFYQQSNSCPLIDTIISNNMKGVNNGNQKENEKTQGQESLHTNS